MIDAQQALLVVAVIFAGLLLVWARFHPPARIMEALIIGIVAFGALVLGVYHATHDGIVSGILELAAFLMLLAAGIIALRRE